MKIPATKNPFSLEEANIAEAVHFDELSKEDDPLGERTVGIRVPSWSEYGHRETLEEAKLAKEELACLASGSGTKAGEKGKESMKRRKAAQ